MGSRQPRTIQNASDLTQGLRTLTCGRIESRLKLHRQEAVMTRICKLPRQGQLVRWIKAGAAVGTIMAIVVATTVLAVSNSAQSGQAKTYRAERAEFRALERHLPWSGARAGYQVLL
jgi:hypothetical protein